MKALSAGLSQGTYIFAKSGKKVLDKVTYVCAFSFHSFVRFRPIEELAQ